MNKKTAAAIETLREEFYTNPMACYTFISMCGEISLRGICSKYPNVSYDSIIRKNKLDFEGDRTLEELRLYKGAHTLQPYMMELFDTFISSIEASEKFKENETNLRNSLHAKAHGVGS